MGNKILNCQECGEIFLTRNISTKRCLKCRHKKYQDRIVNCPECGEEYYRKNIYHKQCYNCSNATPPPRYLIFKRDGFRCMYCGSSPIEDGIKLVVDHIIPLKKGGSGNMDNLITSCEQCNASKNANLLTEDITEFMVNKNKHRNSLIIPNDIKTATKYFLNDAKNRRQYEINS